MTLPSKSQIDRLGRRLAENPTDEDRRAYFDLREQHAEDMVEIERRLHELFPEYSVTARLKTLDTVVAKLQREHTRLSTMQDIAGCRVVIPMILEQDQAVSRIAEAIPTERVVDLRNEPHSGYRAVHVIARPRGDLAVEIQVRTQIQDLWAQVSEKASDRFGLDIKYGGGDETSRAYLRWLSLVGQRVEEFAQAAEVYHNASTALESTIGERQTFYESLVRTRPDFFDGLAEDRERVTTRSAQAMVLGEIILQAFRDVLDDTTGQS